MDEAFELMNDQTCNITDGLDESEIREFKHLVTRLVKATDMQEHSTQLTTMQMYTRLHGRPENVVTMCWLLHCADIGNPTKGKKLITLINKLFLKKTIYKCFLLFCRSKEWSIYMKWTERIMEEFYQIGDRERQADGRISIGYDRERTRLENVQISFSQTFVRPAYATLTLLLQKYELDELDVHADLIK